MFDPGLIDLVMYLRRRSISDTDILAAFETTPRRYFVDKTYMDVAYDDRPIPIDCGQTLPAPLTLAMMAHFAQLRPDHKVLIIGTGSGYFSAIVAKLVKRVYSVDRYKTLCEQAEQRIHALGIPNIVIDHRDGSHGWAGQAPFDRIIICAEIGKIPKRLIAQIGTKGHILYGKDARLWRYENGEETALIDMELPLLQSGLAKTL